MSKTVSAYLLGVICAHGFGCYSGLGTSTIVWTEVFWSSSDIIGRSERAFGCRSGLVHTARVKPTDNLDDFVFRRRDHSH